MAEDTAAARTATGRATAEHATEDWWLLRIGAGAGIVGSLVSMVANFFHPATPPRSDDPEGVARTIAEFGAWVPVHLAIVAGLVLMLLGLVALARSIRGGMAGALARLGHVAAVVGITVGLLLLIVDGVAAKYLADAWASASPGEQPVALELVLVEETINFALAALFNIMFAGVTFVLLGLAVAFSDVYPRGLGWVAVAAGVASMLVGLIQSFEGDTTAVSRLMTIVSPTVLTLWTALLLVLLSGRVAARRQAATPRPAGRTS